MNLISHRFPRASSLPQDFYFSVQRRKYFCNRECAAILSDKVARMLEKNPNCKRLVVKYPDHHFAFNEISGWMNGGCIDLAAEGLDLVALLSLATELEASELRSQIQDFLWSKREVTCENVFDIIEAKQQDGLEPERELSFLAEHFNDAVLKEPAQADLFIKLGVGICRDVLSHCNSDSRDEDALLRAVLARGDDFFELLPFISFERVSIETMELLVKQLDVDKITEELWRALGRRLVCPVGKYEAKSETSAKPKVSSASNQFEYHGNFKDGIISYLTRKYHGNLVDVGVVSMTATDTFTVFSSCELKYILTIENDSEFYCSQNSVNPLPFFQIDFRDIRVQPTGYALGTYVFGVNNQHLKSWVVEGSLNGEDWVEIDRRDDDNQLNGQFRKAYYQATAPAKSPMRYIRLRMTGPSHRNDYQLLCSFMELFGGLSE